LHVHIYDYADGKQSDMYTQTTKEIAGYVGRTYKYGGYAKLAMESLTEATWTEPSDPPTMATLTQKRIWEKEVDEFVKRRQYFELNMTSIYSLLWGQYSEAMRTTLMSISTHGAIAHASNAIDLLKNIRDTVYNLQGQQYKD
jgi:hypothetical protein